MQPALASAVDAVCIDRDIARPRGTFPTCVVAVVGAFVDGGPQGSPVVAVVDVMNGDGSNGDGQNHCDGFQLPKR